MLQQLKKRKDSEGFTIIEVLIVLAIAGLIMVVVFLAVPALQRSGRNNAINSDANAVLTAVGNYSSNNGGSLPAAQAAAAPSSGVATIGSSGNTETAKVGTGTNKVSIVVEATTTPALTATAANVGSIEAVLGVNAVCNATATGLAGGGSPRSYAVVYIAEGGSGPIMKCIGG